MNFVSSDAHVIEPPDLWERHIHPAYRERAPKLVRLDGDDRWVADGRYRMGNLGNASAAGKRFEEGEIELRGRFADVRRGAWDPLPRLADMDVDGVFAEVLYPTVTMHAFRIPDGGLVNAVIRAYNAWLAEFCAAAPTRLFGAGLVLLDDIDAAVAMLPELKAAGMVAAAIPSRPPKGGYDDPRYDRFWACAAELGMPLSLHVGSQRETRPREGLEQANSDLGRLATREVEIRHTLVELIFSGVFQRHPALRVVALEYEVSWIPYFLFRMDDMYMNRPQGRMGARFADGVLPSDVFREHILVSFQEDPHLVRSLPVVGAERLMWGSDFPHSESTWPKSVEVLDELLADLVTEDVEALTGGTARALYGIPAPPEAPA